MGDACGGIFAAGHGFLAESSWNYLLAAIIAGLFFAQLGFLLGGGARLLKATHRAAGRKRIWRCPALAAITGKQQAARICLAEESGIRACSAGLFRPRILVSPALVDLLSGEELRAVVAHEQAHCRWRDNLLLSLAKPLAITFFYVPGARLAYRQLQASIEYAADLSAAGEAGVLSVAAALARIGSARSGARMAGQPARATIAVAVTGQGENELVSRVRSLINDEAPRRACGRVLLFIGALLVATTVFAASAMAVVGSDQRDAFVCFTQHQDGSGDSLPCDLDHSNQTG